MAASSISDVSYMIPTIDAGRQRWTEEKKELVEALELLESEEGVERVDQAYTSYLNSYHTLKAQIRVGCARAFQSTEGKRYFNQLIKGLLTIKRVHCEFKRHLFVNAPASRETYQQMHYYRSCLTAEPLSAELLAARSKSIKEAYMGWYALHQEISVPGLDDEDYFVRYEQLSSRYFSIKTQLSQLLLQAGDSKKQAINKLADQITALYRRIPSPETRVLGSKCMEIPDASLTQIQQNFDLILSHDREQPSPTGFQFFFSQKSHRVFSVKPDRSLLFKIQALGDPESMRKRLKNIEIGRLICKKNGYKRLKIPSAQLITLRHRGKQFQCLVERRLPDLLSASNSKRLYYGKTPFPKDFVLSLANLTHFIGLSGFSDMAARNAPVWIDPKTNCPRIALIDLEEYGGAELGYFGGVYNLGRLKRAGLLCLLDDENVRRSVIETAKKFGVTQEVPFLASSGSIYL